MGVLTRKQVYLALEQQQGGRFAKVVNSVLIGLIVINVVAVVLATEPLIRQSIEPFFVYLETLTLVVFSIEFLLRIWSSVEDHSDRYRHPVWGRLRFILRPIILIDLLAIAPFYLSMFIGTDLVLLRVVRIILLFKFTRYSKSMSLMAAVVRHESGTLFSAFVILTVVIVFAAAGIYWLEGEEQPAAFGSIPRAIWWSTVTVTTVGYGDIVPLTLMGKVFGIFILLTGIAMAALPAGILASGFTAEINRRREQIRSAILAHLVDGLLLTKDREIIYRLCNDLGVPKTAANTMISELTHRHPDSNKGLRCPHCHKPVYMHEMLKHHKG